MSESAVLETPTKEVDVKNLDFTPMNIESIKNNLNLVMDAVRVGVFMRDEGLSEEEEFSVMQAFEKEHLYAMLIVGDVDGKERCLLGFLFYSLEKNAFCGTGMEIRGLLVYGKLPKKAFMEGFKILRKRAKVFGASLIAATVDNPTLVELFEQAGAQKRQVMILEV